MSDRQNLPRPAPEVSEDAIPSIEEIPEDVLMTGDPLEGELPDVEAGDAYLDRQILEPGAEGGLGDDEPDSVAEAGMGLEDTLSAEEAAMQIVDEPPGMNYDPDPGYVDYEAEAQR